MDFTSIYHFKIISHFNKKIVFLIFVTLCVLFIIYCDELNPPEYYTLIPGRLIIDRVIVTNDDDFLIFFSWPEYSQFHTGLEFKRDDDFIANLIPGSTEYVDTLTYTGIYEYRLFAIIETRMSLPSYIRVQISSSGNYFYWYE